MRLESLESRRLLASDVIVGSIGNAFSYTRAEDFPSNTVTYSPNIAGTSGPGFAEISTFDLESDLSSGFNVIVETEELGSTDSGNISYSGDIDVANDAGLFLQFNADNSLILSSGSISSPIGSFDVTFNAGLTPTANSGILIADISIDANGGTISLNSPAGQITTPGTGDIGSASFTAQTLAIDGELSVGGDDTPGTLAIDANLTFSDTSSFNVDIFDTTPGIDFDQIAVTGTVTLNGATLVTSASLATNVGQTIEIISNDGIDAVSGTFAGLPEGSTVDVGGLPFSISYTGGDGNDVTLTEIADNIIAGTDSDDSILVSLDSLQSPPRVEVFINSVLMRSYIQGSINELTINALGGSDRLTVDLSGGDPIPVNGLIFNGGGGIGDSDELSLTGGSTSMITHTFLNPNDGSVDIDGALVSYTGLEPIADNLDASDRIFNFQGGSETISLSNAQNVDGANLIDSTLGESVVFTNPSRSLTINSGSGDDVIDITTLDPGYQASLIVDGGDGLSDSLTINGVDIDTNQQGRGLELRELESIAITQAVIHDNTANLSGGLGGGIYIENSTSGVTTSAIIDSVEISNNTASLGGGVYASDVSLTIQDSDLIVSNTSSFEGGGIYSDGGSLAISSSIISSNVAGESGGGVYVDGGALTITSTTVSGNQALGSDSGGGGVYLLGSGITSPVFSIIDTYFGSNQANSGGGGLEIVDNPGSISGGLYELNTVTGGILNNEGGGGIVTVATDPANLPAIGISGVTIRENSAPSGGGLAAVNPNLTLDSVLIENNSTISTAVPFPTAGAGGGIAAIGNSVNGSITITNSSIQNNTAVGDAGGIGVADVDLSLTDTTVTGNGSSVPVGGRAGGIGIQGVQRTPVLTANRVTIDNNVATQDGGGVGLIEAGLDFTNVTISDNESLTGTGGGLLYNTTDPGATRRIAFSTFASNTDPTFPSNITATGASIDLFATLFADGVGVFDPTFSFNSLGYNTNNSSPPGLDDPTDILMFDTPLLPLADNGGTVQTRSTSSKIPQVHDRVDSFSTIIDARGVSRSSSLDQNADVGAHEFVSIAITNAQSQFDISADEGDGQLTVFVQPDRAIPEPVTIGANLVSGGSNPANIPGDLSANSASFSFAAGDVLGQSYDISIVDDSDIEPTETFSVTASTTSPFFDASTVQAIGNLVDNDVLASVLDLTLQKVADRSSAVPGADRVVYTITVGHDSDSNTDASLVSVSDTLPAGMSLVSLDAPGATTSDFDDSTGLAFVTYSSIPVGQIRTISITADVSAATIGTLTNSATVSVSGGSDIDTTNNTDSTTVTLTPQADLAVSKTVDAVAAVPGQLLTYTIFVQNNGPSNATDVTVDDVLPSDVTFVSGSGPNGPLSEDSQIVVGNLTGLVPAGVAQFVITATVNAGAIGSLTNTATVSSSTTDTNLFNNSDTVTTTITQAGVVLTGHVYCDANGNGTEDLDEAAVGARVFIDANNNGLYDSNETFVTTNTSGDYTFDTLPSGNQTVTLIVPDSSCLAVPETFPNIETGVELGQVIRDAFAYDINDDGLDEYLTVAENSQDLTIVSSFDLSMPLVSIPLGNRPQAVHAWGYFQSSTSSKISTIAVAAYGVGQTTADNGLLKTNPGAVYTFDTNGNQDQFTAGEGPIDVIVDDFNGDNLADVLVASYLSNSFHLKFGGSSTVSTIGSADGALLVNSGDFDGDGHRDIVMGGYGFGASSFGSLQVRLNQGDGSFSSPMNVPLSSRLINTAVADVDYLANSSGDELVVLGTNGLVTTYSISADGITERSSLQLEAGTSKIAAGYINGDEQIDLAVVRNLPRTSSSGSIGPAAGTIDLLLNDGDGNFFLAKSTSEVTNPAAVAFASVDSYVQSDLVVAEQSNDQSGGTTTFLRLGLDQKTVTVNANVTAVADFNPSSDVNNLDVNQDSRVTLVDALQIINEINANDAGLAEPLQATSIESDSSSTSQTTVQLPSRKDVNRDGKVTALDALMVINHVILSEQSESASEPLPVSAMVNSDDDRHTDVVDELMLEPNQLF
ncbi:dockerin type I domain-containing protein [Rhodopirellula sallentina]|uniref:Protein containing DUF11 n=1 Tax=Rhodopirellula sallentina SM41 TaxID=1263870 RepID=M5UIL9_9BACT|nr:dockerin type I domain-containing protein [Rhodopirellula sallentina]EMI55873.1 protein containing DUF11 [Rhodopirellula sallentina SM41]